MAPCLDEFPTELRIGFADWIVENVPHGALTEDKDGDDETKVFGITDKAHLTIKIEEGWSDQQTLDTLVHELQHAIWYAMGLDDKVEEETAVTALSHGWVMVMRDNPELCVWWVNHMCEGVDEL